MVVGARDLPGWIRLTSKASHYVDHLGGPVPQEPCGPVGDR